MGRARRPAAETVADALAHGTDLTAVEIASRAGVGVSTAGKALAALAAQGRARRTPGGRAGGRRAPDRWRAAGPVSAADPSDCRPAESTGTAKLAVGTAAVQSADEQPPVDRLGRGQLAGLVLEALRAGDGQPVTAGTVAKALGRPAGAVSNCLQRLAAGQQVTLVSDAPRRYTVAR